MKIKKRNNQIIDFDKNKIVQAIVKSMNECERGVDEDLAWSIAEEIENEFEDSNVIPTVESVSDRVEELLAENGRFDVSRRYILFREERTKLRNRIWEMNDLQKDVYDKKYRYEKETFDEFINRVSGGNEQLAKLIRNRDFLFGGRILAGRGINRNVSLANCTTLPAIEDNIESIFETAKQLARMYSYGNGVGIDMSKLRHRGAKVNNASKTSTGAVSFMEIFDSVGNVIGAEGRRAALLIMLDAMHKDIEEFITVKSDTNKITNANLSVKASDDFMALNTQRKKEIMKKISEYAWDNGEPALLYWQNIKNWHLLSHDDEYIIDGVNACTEFTTTAYGTCLLGSINLSNFVINPYTDDAYIDYERLKYASRIVTIGMNEVLDEAIPTHPLEKQREVANNYKQIGVGIMGLGSAFIKLGVKYGDSNSITITSKIMETIRDNVILQSIELAKKYGAFPKYNYDKIKDAPYFQSLPEYIRNEIKAHGLYNSTFLSIAPAGSISLLADVTNGLEPLYALSYNRTTKSLGATDKVYKVYPKEIQELMDAKNIFNEADLPEYCVTAHDIIPRDRIDVQAEIQKYTDLAISSTVNLGEKTTPEEIEDIYVYAYEKGLKGVSVFRENCARIGILQSSAKEDESTFECDT